LLGYFQNSNLSFALPCAVEDGGDSAVETAAAMYCDRQRYRI